MTTEVLLTPGPTHIPDQVFEAMAQPTMHHRTERFRTEFRKALNGLRSLLQLPHDPILLAGSGTAGMEAALLNLCNRGDKVLVVNGGKFGERWLHIASALGLNAIELPVPWGTAAHPEAVISMLQKHSDTRAVCLQHCETSTGVLHPIDELCTAVADRFPDILTVVDAVSSAATTPLYPALMNIDVVVTACHKGLMTPPGLAIVALSERAWNVAEHVTPRSLYFNLLVERKAHSNDTTAWTPAMNHILGLNAALAMIQREGAEAVFTRHQRIASACRAAVTALGLQLYAAAPAPGVTAVVVPEGCDGELLRATMLKDHNVRIAGGQAELKGKVIRFGHMGYVNMKNVEDGIIALESALVSHTGMASSGKGQAVFTNLL